MNLAIGKLKGRKMSEVLVMMMEIKAMMVHCCLLLLLCL